MSPKEDTGETLENPIIILTQPGSVRYINFIIVILLLLLPRLSVFSRE